MEIRAAIAKAAKYATSESGDTFEMIERPHGGLSFVLADGQWSGKAAKVISNLVARKAVSLLGEGVRDGAVARATHDYLRTHRRGRVSATLVIVSVDLSTGSVVISRNTPCPVIIVDKGGPRLLDEPCPPIGIHAMTKPVITELPLSPDTWIIAFTDGMLSAGERYGLRLDVVDFVTRLLCPGEGPPDFTSIGPEELAEALLKKAMELDKGRPSDDISVLVVAITPAEREDQVRRMSLSFPIPPTQARPPLAPAGQ